MKLNLIRLLPLLTLAVTATLFISSASSVSAALQGNQTLVQSPGEKDDKSRVSGFSYGDTYYLAFGRRTGMSTYIPSLIYGQATLSNANPPVLGYQQGKELDIPGINQGYYRCHMATGFAGNAPYIFQFNCSRGSNAALQSITYEKLIPPVIAGNAPTFSAIKSVPSSLINNYFSGFAVGDVSAASIGSSLYLFVVMQANPPGSPDFLWVMKYDGSGTGGPQLVNALELGYYPNSNQHCYGVDATSVTLASGEQAIVLVTTQANSSSGGNPHVKAWLINDNIVNFSQPTPPITLTQPRGLASPSVRLAYGGGTGTAKTKSCTLFYGGIDTSAFFTSAVIQTTQINLPASLKAGNLSQLGSWAGLGNMWSNLTYDNYNTEFPYRWTVFSTALPTSTTSNGYANVDQFLTLLAFGEIFYPNTQDSFVSSLTLQLQVDPSTAGQQWASGDLATYTGPNAKAAVQSWNLLGVITGTPPLPTGTKVTYTRPILAIKYSNSQTTGAAQTSKTAVATSAKLGGPDFGFNASAGYTNATIQGSESSNTTTLSVDEAYHSSSKGTYDKYSNTGYLIVSEPNYYTAHYNVFAYDGTTQLGISTVSIIADGTNIESIPFYLDQPNKPYPGYPAFIYQSFPTDSSGQTLVAWPHTDDIEGWEPQNGALPTLTNVQPLFKQTATTLIDGSDTASSGLSLSSSALNNYTRETSNTVDIGTGINFLGIKVGTTGSVTLNSTQSTAFSSSEDSNIMYPQLQDSNGYSYIQIQAIFDKVGNKPDSQANWIPTIFSGSQPWILTWQVNQAVPISGKQP